MGLHIQQTRLNRLLWNNTVLLFYYYTTIYYCTDSRGLGVVTYPVTCPVPAYPCLTLEVALNPSQPLPPTTTNPSNHQTHHQNRHRRTPPQPSTSQALTPPYNNFTSFHPHFIPHPKEMAIDAEKRPGKDGRGLHHSNLMLHSGMRMGITTR